MTDSVCEEVLVELRKILRAISLQSRHLSQSCGITTPQLLVMRAIGRLGAMTVGQLSKEVNLSQATVTAIVDRLERKLFVSRERSAVDRRRVHVILTEQGKEALSKVPSPVQDSFARAFSGLEDWEQNLILSSFQRVAKMMGAAELPADLFLVEDPQLPSE